jgi:flagellar hook-basal body complex protein FliE
MRIDASLLNQAPHAVTSAAGTAREALKLSPDHDSGPGFGDVLNGFLGKVNTSQNQADHMVESLALGEPVDVHQVMIALGEASNSLQLTMQVRNKVLEAYQELMKTPI